MSNAVFPVLPGLTWDITRVPMWSTTVKTAVSGREYRSLNYSAPRYRYKLTYSVLRQTPALLEMSTLAGFFNARGGSFDSFLFIDPDDSVATNEQYGTSDGVTTAWQLLRSFGGYSEPIYDIVPGSLSLQTVDWMGTCPVYAVLRTNLCPWSEAMQNWGLTNGTASTDVAVAPDGSTTADKFVESTAANVVHLADKGVTIVAGSANTFSIFLKAAGRTQLDVYFGKSTTPFTRIGMRVDLTNGTFTNIDIASPLTVNTRQVQALANGWYRITLSGTFDLTSTDGYFEIRPWNGTTESYTGDGVSGYYAWGSQVEAVATTGAYVAGRYIKTPTATSASYQDCTFPSFYQSGVVTFTNPLPTGCVMTWSGQFYRRVRFEQDTAEFNQFMQKLWNLQSLTLLSVKP